YSLASLQADRDALATRITKLTQAINEFKSAVTSKGDKSDSDDNNDDAKAS
ncbi:MAG: hypothetical protein IH960_00895, partial [Chloroflexi bacterium]|nr:hypothetical protein [Chloroflexota bacterium]